MAASLDVLLAEATQLRNIAQALTQKLAEAADNERGSVRNHLHYARSHALAIDALAVNVEVGTQCALDSASYHMAAVAADPRA